MEQGFTMELGFSISYTSIPDALTVPGRTTPSEWH